MPTSIKHLRRILAEENAPMHLFALWEGDGLYYQVKLIKLDEKNFKATIRYEDGSEFRVKTASLHVQFNSDESPDEEEIVCGICEGPDSVDPNNLVLCDVCQQGYHQECHEPKITNEDIESDWSCKTCAYMLEQQQQQQQQPKARAKTPSKITKSKPLPKKPRIALKPRAPVNSRPARKPKEPELPAGASVDSGSKQVQDAASALLKTDEFMSSIEDAEGQQEESVKGKKKKATKGSKQDQVPQPA